MLVVRARNRTYPNERLRALPSMLPASLPWEPAERAGAGLSVLPCMSGSAERAAAWAALATGRSESFRCRLVLCMNNQYCIEIY